jgi:hypothetical protein
VPVVEEGFQAEATNVDAVLDELMNGSAMRELDVLLANQSAELDALFLESFQAAATEVDAVLDELMGKSAGSQVRGAATRKARVRGRQKARG